MTNRERVVAVVLTFVALAAAWIHFLLPYQKIRQMHQEFASVERGDTEDTVRAKLASARLVSSPASAPFWNETPFSETAKDEIRSSIGEKIDTLFLPVTVVISFDASGKVIGKHIYD